MRLNDPDVGEADVADVLHVLDHAVPPLDFESVVRAATEPATESAIEPALAGARARAERPAPAVIRRTIVSTAAILALTAAAAAALPSVRHAILRAVGVGQSAPSAAAPVTASPALTAPMAQSAPGLSRGVAITADGRANLVFRSGQPGGMLRIRPTLGSRVAVTASADGPTYTVGRGTILIDTRAAGMTYDIALPLPAALPEVTIRIGDEIVFARHGTTVDTRGVLFPDGAYHIAMSGGTPR